MKFRTAAILLCLALAGAGFLLAKDFWEGPFDKWSRNDVVKMLNSSPWAGSQTFAATSMTKEAGNRGENELYHKFTVRFFSALPIREAYVRMFRIMNKYDDMDAGQRQQFDTRFNKPLTLDVSDKVIVALERKTDDPNVERDLRSFFETARVDTLKQSVYLITQGNGRVEIKEYYPPSPDGSGAKFVFPRTIGGKPIISESDKELKFDMWMPAVNQRLFVDFKPPKMVYKGTVAY